MCLCWWAIWAPEDNCRKIVWNTPVCFGTSALLRAYSKFPVINLIAIINFGHHRTWYFCILRYWINIWHFINLKAFRLILRSQIRVSQSLNLFFACFVTFPPYYTTCQKMVTLSHVATLIVINHYCNNYYNKGCHKAN